MESVSDDDLMRLYRDGDADAFDTLFDRHYVSAYNFARTILGCANEAEDVLQETFLAVAQKADSYDGRGQFRAWLMRIVRNRCLNRLESRRARRAFQPGDAITETTASGACPQPSERVESKEMFVAIGSAIANLPERQREAISLYAFEQMGYREIAEVLEMPVNTV